MSSYLIFTFQSLHKLHCEISRLVKEWKVTCLSSNRLRTGGRQEKRVACQYTCSGTAKVLVFPFAIERDRKLPRTHNKFWQNRLSNDWDGISIRNGPCGMLVGSD